VIKVNLDDGKVLSFDLNDASDYQQWLEWSSLQDFQRRITGVGIIHDKRFHTFQYPKNFKKVNVYAESVFNTKAGAQRKLGERLIVHADEVKLELLVYTYDHPKPPILSRTTMTFVGKQMFAKHAYKKRGLLNEHQ
jgi:hypothetical protein